MCEGFSNEPTWLLSFHINNDQKKQEFWLDAARDAKDIFGSSYRLARCLEKWFIDNMPEPNEGVYYELWDFVFNQIEWTEVAQELLTKLDEMDGE